MFAEIFSTPEIWSKRMRIKSSKWVRPSNFLGGAPNF